MLKKLIVVWKWYWISRRHRRQNLSPTHPQALFELLEVLDVQLFEHYKRKVGKDIDLSMRAANVTALMERLAYVSKTLTVKGYFDHQLINNTLPEVTLTLDEFLVTRRNYPVRPQELVEELTDTMASIAKAVEALEGDTAYREYCLRKPEWVFESTRYVMEALYLAAKRV